MSETAAPRSALRPQWARVTDSEYEMLGAQVEGDGWRVVAWVSHQPYLVKEYRADPWGFMVTLEPRDYSVACGTASRSGSATSREAAALGAELAMVGLRQLGMTFRALAEEQQGPLTHDDGTEIGFMPECVSEHCFAIKCVAPDPADVCVVCRRVRGSGKGRGHVCDHGAADWPDYQHPGKGLPAVEVFLRGEAARGLPDRILCPDCAKTFCSTVEALAESAYDPEARAAYRAYQAAMDGAAG